MPTPHQHPLSLTCAECNKTSSNSRCSKLLLSSLARSPMVVRISAPVFCFDFAQQVALIGAFPLFYGLVNAALGQFSPPLLRRRAVLFI